MKVLCSSVLAMEALVVLLATSLVTSNGAVANPTRAWIAGLVVMVLLIAAIGTLRRPWGLAVGWVLQVLVVATSIVVGWSMLVVGLLFAILWGVAIHLGYSFERGRSHQEDGDDA